MSIKITTLANGMRIVSDPMTTVESATLGVWVNVGTRHETPEMNGISHLLEHMAFKGTKKRSALDISREIEAVGGHINAYTSRESTAYYVKVLKDDVALGIDLIADILQNSIFDPNELDRERNVILQEILQTNDTPDEVIFDNFQQTAYPNQPIGRQILGNSKIVKSLKRDKLMRYMASNYNNSTMVLAAAGKVNHDELVGQTEYAFRNLRKGNNPNNKAANYIGGENIVSRDIEQAHLLLGFEGVDYRDKSFYALAILSTILGGGMSSRLFQEIRERHALAYSIYSFTKSYSDSGLFGIYAGTGEKETKTIIPLICNEIKNICKFISSEELQRARNQIKASILMALESSSSRCELIAKQILIFDRPISVKEIISNIEAVDIDILMDTAQRTFSSPLTVAALGPISELENIEKIKKRLP